MDELPTPSAKCGVCGRVSELSSTWTVIPPGKTEPHRLCEPCWNSNLSVGSVDLSDVDGAIERFKQQHTDLESHREEMELIAAAARAERMAIQEVALLGALRAPAS